MRRSIDQKHSIIETVHSYSIVFDTREIFIHGEPDVEGLDAGIDFRVANKFLKNIRLLEKSGSDPIIVHQYTDGGCWDSGMMMYDIIKNCSCYIIFVMHGISASMGSIIPQSSDVRIIMPNCLFMIHGGSNQTDGTYKQLQSLAEIGKHTYDTMLEIYTNVAINGPFFQENNYTIRKVRNFLVNKMNQKEDWWLSSREVVKYGFCDAVFGDKGYENIDIIRNNLLK